MMTLNKSAHANDVKPDKPATAGGLDEAIYLMHAVEHLLERIRKLVERFQEAQQPVAESALIGLSQLDDNERHDQQVAALAAKLQRQPIACEQDFRSGALDEKQRQDQPTTAAASTLLQNDDEDIFAVVDGTYDTVRITDGIAESCNAFEVALAKIGKNTEEGCSFDECSLQIDLEHYTDPSTIPLTQKGFVTRWKGIIAWSEFLPPYVHRINYKEQFNMMCESDYNGTPEVNTEYWPSTLYLHRTPKENDYLLLIMEQIAKKVLFYPSRREAFSEMSVDMGLGFSGILQGEDLIDLDPPVMALMNVPKQREFPCYVYTNMDDELRHMRKQHRLKLQRQNQRR